MRYCKHCILPSTRPQVEIEHKGVCSACVGSFEKDNAIDWQARERDLRQLLETNRPKGNDRYDCLIPVSGGKDSTWQVHTLVNTYGLKPLAYTWKPQMRTEIGRRNLENLINLGVDHIDYTVNPKVEKTFMLKAFRQNGSPSLCEHMAMFSLALRLAINFKIPMVIWGENSGMEYGGGSMDRFNPRMDHDWIRKYGVSNGTFSCDWVCQELSEKDLLPYTYPSAEEIDAAQIMPIFLGWFLRWDPYEVAMFSRSVGFEWAPKPQVGYYPYADLDAPFIVIHHMFKWYKFGFTRTWDNLSIEIRNGRMTRDEAVEIIRKPEPVPYDQVYQLCRYLGISEMQFWEIVESHRNHDIWKKDANGRWFLPGMIEEFGFYTDNYSI